MADVYASASIFLFTSIRDTFSVQNLEAMSHGLPMVYRASAGVGVSDFFSQASAGVTAGRHGFCDRTGNRRASDLA